MKYDWDTNLATSECTRFSSSCTIRKVAAGAKQRILQKKRKKSRSGNSGIFEGSNGCRLSENNAIQKLNEDFFQNTASTNRHDLTGGGGPFMCWYDSVGVYCTLYSPWTRRSRLPLQVVEYNQKGHTAVQCCQSTVFECRLHSTTRLCIVYGQTTVVRGVPTVAKFGG